MITPTQLIYQAYQVTPKPLPLPNNKTVQYPMVEMKPVSDDLCWLCGGDTQGLGLPCKDVIRKTFTSTPYAKAIESRSLCSGCAWTLLQKYLRNYSLLVVNGLFEHPSRARIRDLLVDPPRTYPWMLSIAVSGQKHISFPGHINRTHRDLRVLLEQVPVRIPPDGIKSAITPMVPGEST